jgi:hypothetical protein
MMQFELTAETLAELRQIRRQHGISFAYISDILADEKPNDRLVVGSIHLNRENSDNPLVEIIVTEHYDAMCGAIDGQISPFPCALRPGHKGEHRYGSEYRFREMIAIPLDSGVPE